MRESSGWVTAPSFRFHMFINVNFPTSFLIFALVPSFLIA
jgi:hypothetical protein